MDITGKWMIAKIPDFNDDGLVYIDKDEALKAKKVDKDLKFMLKAIYVITEDHMTIQMELKGKEKQEAIEEGMTNIEGDWFEVDGMDIIKKKDNYYFEMGYDGMNDKPHLEPLRLDEDGYLDYMLFKLGRI
jgi:hypothetical protein